MLDLFNRNPRSPRPAAGSAPAIEALESRTLLSSVPLGGNLNQQTDRIQDHPFVDLVTVTRGFFNSAGNLVPTDSRGWPTQDFSFSADDQSEYGVQITPGTYHLSFTGPAGVSVTTLASAPARAPARPSPPTRARFPSSPPATTPPPACTPKTSSSPPASTPSPSASPTPPGR